MTKQLSVIGVIPARLASTRLPTKLLQDIHGHPLIYFTYQAAQQARLLERVIIACDDQRIAAAAAGFGAEAIITSSSHPSGTSRIAEIAEQVTADIIVNIQGDEPLIHPDTIDAVAQTLLDAPPDVDMATAAINSTDQADYHDPNVVKVVINDNHHAIYFSRSPIPYFRDDSTPIQFRKHLGIYAYRRHLLLRLSTIPPSPLARFENLEQLTPLAAGVTIAVADVTHDSIGVDTADDLAQARHYLMN